METPHYSFVLDVEPHASNLQAGQAPHGEEALAGMGDGGGGRVGHHHLDSLGLVDAKLSAFAESSQFLKESTLTLADQLLLSLGSICPALLNIKRRRVSEESRTRPSPPLLKRVAFLWKSPRTRTTPASPQSLPCAGLARFANAVQALPSVQYGQSRKRRERPETDGNRWTQPHMSPPTFIRRVTEEGFG